MVETVGKKLQHSRLRRQISVEDAARGTRMRPSQIIDLENDNYTNFPNAAYAKGFLLIYAKFLGVDVGEFAETMESVNPVAVDEYEYLNAPVDRGRVVHRPQKKHALMPLLILALLLIAAAVVMYIYAIFMRLGNLEQIAEKGGASPAASSSPSAAAVPAATPELAPAVSP